MVDVFSVGFEREMAVGSLGDPENADTEVRSTKIIVASP